MSNTLKLLDDLEKLNGLPLEKKGQEIKNSLPPISDEMKNKIEGITNPYILIEGDRHKAIRLAAYIYLEKSTVYSDFDLLEKLKNLKDSMRTVKKAEMVYFDLAPEGTEQWQNGTWINYRCYRDGRPTHSGVGSLGRFYDAIASHYQWEKAEGDKPPNAKDKPIKIIYQNHFGLADWIIDLSKLNQLELIHISRNHGGAVRQGFSYSMTCFNMLKFKKTVFLLDFMKRVKDEDLDHKALLEFSNELHELRKSTPGFLIIHVDKKRKWHKDYLDQFETIPAGKKKTEVKGAGMEALAKNRATKTDNRERKEYKEIQNKILKKYNKALEAYPSLKGFAERILEGIKEYNKKIIDECKAAGKTVMKETLLFEYKPNSIETHIQNHPLVRKIQKRKDKLQR